MSKIIIDPTDYLEEDDGWLLLARRTFNDRTLLCWYNGLTEEYNIALFHLLERPNLLSQRAKESRWGWMTHFVQNLNQLEATEVANLYMKDLENDNIWWEKGPSTH
ncbi:MAG TPA: hypothetical protein DDY18_01550 [Flavobacterium sp.]|jgi:hypothetical protein|nr:hypothetical protein [Flavobacterium sp.]